MTKEQKQKIKNESLKFIENNQKLSTKLHSCSVENCESVLNYLSSGKSTISYEMITRFDLLGTAPEDEVSFLPQ